MKAIRFAPSLVLAALLAGCSTASPEKLELIRIGMTKDQLASVLGQPASTSASGEADFEYLTYRLAVNDRQGRTVYRDYYVRLFAGKVVAFSRYGTVRGAPDWPGRG
jgi:outer membrane protein assembly factor BamE (lipoprotein component of BamABCDE complex)